MWKSIAGNAQLSVNTLQCPSTSVQERKSDCRIQNSGKFSIIFQSTDGISFPEV